jgi:pantothenate kinase-related protein Tda10
LEILLKKLGFYSISQSIDDHYITHLELCELREEDSQYIRRGVTHDILLATRDLKNLQTIKEGEVIVISGYDKGAQSGDGDRFRFINPVSDLEIHCAVKEKFLTVNKLPQKTLALEISTANYKNESIFLPSNMGSDIPLIEPMLPASLIEFLKNQKGEIIITLIDNENVIFKGDGEITVSIKDLPHGWRIVNKKPDFIFYDGWMVGARSVDDESVFESNLPALDTPEHIDFAKKINKKLLNYYQLWEMFKFVNVLYVVDYSISVKWRDQAEEHLRQKGAGMNSEEIKEFVYYFWRSVHPAIQIKNLAQDNKHANQVVVIDDKHLIQDILTPTQVKEKYN